METIRTETQGTITREVRIPENTTVIEKSVEKSDNTALWIVIAVVVFIGLTQGRGAGCQARGRGGWEGGHGGHGGHGPIVKVTR